METVKTSKVVGGWKMNRLSMGDFFSSVQSLSSVRLFVTPWTVAYQAPQSVGFSRQEY